MPNKATLRRIAETLHLAESTVSRALSGKKGVNEQTRQRIIAAARDFGYVARLGPLRLPVCVLLLAEEYTLQDKRLWHHVTSGLIAEISQNDSSLSVAVTHAANPSFVPPSLLGYAGAVNGLIALRDADIRAVKFAVELGLPVVLVNSYYDYPGCDSVGIDDFTGVYTVATELARMGHRRFGFVGGLAGPSNRMRRKGLITAMVDAGITGELPRHYVKPEEIGHDSLPTALICSNDAIAKETLKRLLTINVRIPEDVSVVGFDDDPETIAECPIPLTTLHVDQEDLGRYAAKTLFQRLNNPDCPAIQVALKVSLVWRDSCAKPTPG